METNVRNPWTGEFDYSFVNPTPREAIEVAQRLRLAQPGWAATGTAGRIRVLQDFAQRILESRNDLVTQLVKDTGRIRIAELEFDSLQNVFARLTAIAHDAIDGDSSLATADPAIRGETIHEPYGLALNIAPWNFPLLLSLLDALPALLAGNTVLVKPSEVTPRWAAVMQEIAASTPGIREAMQIVVADGSTGSTLIDCCDIVSFTGSVETGRKVYERAARNFIPAYLELGGKDAAIVCGDADIPDAATKILMSAIAGTGQACQSLERVYVQANMHDAFLEALVAAAKAVSINYPHIHEGMLGPFILEKQARKVEAHLQDAVEKGASIVCGGQILDHGGLWLKPTVLTNVTHDMLLMREETFGPVIPIAAFTDMDEAIELANDTEYGLSASVFCGSPQTAHAIAKRLKAGAVSINNASLTTRLHEIEHEPYGFSGMGRSRFGLESIRRYTRKKAIFTEHQA